MGTHRWQSRRAQMSVMMKAALALLILLVLIVIAYAVYRMTVYNLSVP
jgi:hypothetical protein